MPRDELGYLDREQLYALSRLLLDEEQQGILMSLAKNYDKVNKERLGKICNKVFTEKELINAVRRIKEDSVFKLRESGHYYALYRVLTSQVYSKTLFRNSQDFKQWLTDIVGLEGKLFSKSAFSDFGTTELRFPVYEWEHKIRDNKYRSFVYVANEFLRLLNEGI